MGFRLTVESPCCFIERNNMIRIALDMMGGDNCPDCNLDGAFDALGSSDGFELIMVGPEETLRQKTADWSQELRSRISFVNATEVISLNEAPVQAIRKKKDSTITRGAELVKNKEADAFVSAGSSGALLAAGQLKVGRLPGVQRAPLAAFVPTKKGFCFFMDCGANVDAKPEWLCQFAQMGSIYMKEVMHSENPSVKLANLGLEEEKGNALTKEAHAMLKEMPDVNYQGFVEFRDVVYGEADVVVADAFTGNAIIKTLEGTAGGLMGMIKDVLKSSVLTKLAAAVIIKPLRAKIKSFDASEHGGAVLLGLRGPVIKCHGNASRKEIRNALLQARDYISSGVGEKIAAAIADSTGKETSVPQHISVD